MKERMKKSYTYIIDVLIFTTTTIIVILLFNIFPKNNEQINIKIILLFSTKLCYVTALVFNLFINNFFYNAGGSGSIALKIFTYDFNIYPIKNKNSKIVYTW